MQDMSDIKLEKSCQPPSFSGQDSFSTQDIQKLDINWLGLFHESAEMNYIFDSNVYDYLHDQAIATNEIQSIGSIFITNVQLSEVINIPDDQRRQALLATIERVAPQKLQLLSGIWIDELQWDDEQMWNDDVNPECTSLLGNATKNIPWMDALIGEVALHRGLILVTSDQKFAARAASNGIQCVTPNDVFKKKP